MLLLRALAFALTFLSCSGHAAVTPLTSDPALDALRQAHSAVVGVEVTAAEGARSVETLGQERSGSGVVIGPDGLILTIGYLMLEADTIQVVTQDNRTVPARAVAYDVATGFGLLRPIVPLRGVRPVALGSAGDLQSGEPLMAIVGGDEGAVALTRLVNTRPFSGYWEYHIELAVFTSPPVGNHSGAALFNRRGELVGIGSLFVGDASGEGRRMPGNMFVAVDLLKPILGELQRSGTTKASRRPWLGVTSTERDGHVQILRVSAGSPAQAAGLGAGDLILAVDGARVDTLESFYKRVWEHAEPESEVQLVVLQDGQVRSVTVKAVDRTRLLAKPPGI